ncbi:hypothetical protein OBBRIDRAFT_803027 [Obba rivulosa]|uniref:Uncharacterized protein n=1 Tax=Obba rivulosa TaxID=1052685 RepID=A0A8E2AZ52_9APHY|nr:hypothetical protein OBBRIDRAFT_803027 [Obba rivulosa]
MDPQILNDLTENLSLEQAPQLFFTKARACATSMEALGHILILAAGDGLPPEETIWPGIIVSASGILHLMLSVLRSHPEWRGVIDTGSIGREAVEAKLAADGQLPLKVVVLNAQTALKSFESRFRILVMDYRVGIVTRQRRRRLWRLVINIGYGQAFPAAIQFPSVTDLGCVYDRISSQRTDDWSKFLKSFPNFEDLVLREPHHRGDAPPLVSLECLKTISIISHRRDLEHLHAHTLLSAPRSPDGHEEIPMCRGHASAPKLALLCEGAYGLRTAFIGPLFSFQTGRETLSSLLDGGFEKKYSHSIPVPQLIELWIVGRSSGADWESMRAILRAAGSLTKSVVEGRHLEGFMRHFQTQKGSIISAPNYPLPVHRRHRDSTVVYLIRRDPQAAESLSPRCPRPALRIDRDPGALRNSDDGDARDLHN